VIYMVDHVYADPTTEQAWHEWYAGYLQKLVSVPGIHTAQRFKALACTPSRYLAMYSIESADVYSSAAYKNIGGGGSQSVRFQHAYRLWTRNLFDGASRAPVVRDGQRVLVFDREVSPHPNPRITSGAPPLSGTMRGEADVLARAVWLKAVGLHMTTRYRAFVVLGADEVASTPAVPGSYIYEPFTAVLRNQDSKNSEGNHG
jgi:hypothetical protein